MKAGVMQRLEQPVRGHERERVIARAPSEGDPVRDADPRRRIALEVWDALVRATSLVRVRLTADLVDSLGVLPEEIELLRRLDEAPEQRLRMVDLSRSMLLSKSGVTRLVDRLEERGLAFRAPCPKDRRVIWAGLTDEGGAMLAKAVPLLAADLVGLLGSGLEEGDLESLRSVLHRVLENERGIVPATEADAPEVPQ
jgi:DNA-binding MarR family transcriptional regulator